MAIYDGPLQWNTSDHTETKIVDNRWMNVTETFTYEPTEFTSGYHPWPMEHGSETVSEYEALRRELTTCVVCGKHTGERLIMCEPCVEMVKLFRERVYESMFEEIAELAEQ